MTDESRKLPPLNALRAFEVVARYESITKAAAELNVTHAAVSQHVKQLEEALQVALLRRVGKRVSLTEKGATYAKALSLVFDALEQATEVLNQQDQPNVLNIRVPPTLALRWFIPHIQSYQAHNPDIELRVSTIMKEIDFSRDNFDLGIYYGDGTWPRVHKDFLFSDHIFPVCSPAMSGLKNGKDFLEDFQNHKFIYVTTNARKLDWAHWCEAAKIKEPTKSHRIYLSDSLLAYQAAAAGLGVAMAHDVHVLDDLSTSRLIRPTHIKIAAPGSYYLVCPENYLERPKVDKFRRWLLKEARHFKETLLQKLPPPSGYDRVKGLI